MPTDLRAQLQESLCDAYTILRERFLREVEVTARLEHPHVLRSHAHDRDVVHRDVKPGNVLLTASSS